MCLFPKLLPNPKYKSTKKNGGVIPKMIDERVKFVPVGCGKCMECIKQRARGWQIRMSEEIRTDKTGKFVTLTFSNESIEKLAKETEYEGYERDNAIATIGTRYFLERWRKKFGKSLKHWLITELGHKGTENVHLHGILFTNDKEAIKEKWQYGWIFIGKYVNEKTVNYCTKYATKVDALHKYYKPKMLVSPGIGKNYIKRLDSNKNKFNNNGETKETYTTRQGKQVALPIYLRNKIYTEEEKEKLWIQKLDKQIRYVDKQPIDVSTKQGLETYYKALDEAQRKNDRLGYGTDKENWSEKNYEIWRRNANFKARINNINLWIYVDPETGETFEKQNKKKSLIKIKKQ